MTRLVTIKGQLNKVQHENQNLSNKLKEEKWVVRKIENLQQEYAEFNQFNSKTHNDLKHLQVYLEQMMQDCTKMEKSNMEQWNIIIGLEQTCQESRKQQVATHIK